MVKRHYQKYAPSFISQVNLSHANDNSPNFNKTLISFIKWIAFIGYLAFMFWFLQ